MTANRHNSIFYGVDLWTVLLYVLIVMAGWVSITSASYDEGTADVFSFSHFYMKQLMWIGVAWTTAVVVLLLDDRFYHMFAYPAHFAEGLGAVGGRAAVRPRGERGQGVVRVRVVPPAAGRVREDRHGIWRWPA